MHLPLKGSKEGLFLFWGGIECWNQSHDRIANYCPLVHTQSWKRGGRGEWMNGSGWGCGRSAFEVTPYELSWKETQCGPSPPFPSTSLMAQPSRLSSSSRASPPFVSRHRVPIDGPGVCYIAPSCTSNAKKANFFHNPSSFHLTWLPVLVLTSLLQTYKSLSRLDQWGTGKPIKPQGSGW